MNQTPPAPIPKNSMAEGPKPFNHDSSMKPQPLSSPAKTSKSEKSSKLGDIIKISLIIFFVLTTLAAGYLVFYFYNEYATLERTFDEQVDLAVAKSEADLTDVLEKKFTEREKEPYTAFSGPEDYGELSFKYPKTWSVYISKDAVKGGDFEAYFNPGGINPISSTTINALRLTISTKTIETFTKTYESYVSKRIMSANIVEINGNNATLYRGTLPSKLVGAVVLIKLRDKTAILQTDAEIFLDDFLKLLDTITYNS